MWRHHVSIHTQSVLIARNRLSGSDISFDTRYRIVDDTDLWYRLVRMGPVGYLNEVLGSYRMHGNNITKRKWDLAREHLVLHNKNYEAIKASLNEDMLDFYRKKMAIEYDELAYDLYLARRHKEARDQFTRAIEWYPHRLYYFNRLKTYLPPGFAAWMRRTRGT